MRTLEVRLGALGDDLALVVRAAAFVGLRRGDGVCRRRRPDGSRGGGMQGDEIDKTAESLYEWHCRFSPGCKCLRSD